MVRYNITVSQMTKLAKRGYVYIVRNGKRVKVTPSMVLDVKHPKSKYGKGSGIDSSYQSKVRPVIEIEFREPVSFNTWDWPGVIWTSFTGYPLPDGESVRWQMWGDELRSVNEFHFITKRGKSWVDSIKYAKTWFAKNIGKNKIRYIDVEWESVGSTR